jgi:two-component sensor histidine kinase
MWGYGDPAQVLGRPAAGFWLAEGGAARVIDLVQQQGSWSGELVVRRPDGDRLDVQLLASLITGRAGEPLGLMVLFVDVTQRKRTEAQIRASLGEKELFLKEIHHRVRNNLQVISSLLDMQAAQIEEPQARQALIDSHNRIRAIALIHDHLDQPRNLASVDLDSYIHSLSSHLYRVYASPGQDVALHRRVEPIWLDSDIAIPCGLIINELISNAMQHAFPPGSGGGEIWVELDTRADGQIVLTVRDNGSGLSPDIDPARSPSLGLQLVYMLTQQIQGTIHLERTGGTTFQVVFSRPTPKGYFLQQIGVGGSVGRRHSRPPTDPPPDH